VATATHDVTDSIHADELCDTRQKLMKVKVAVLQYC